MSNINNNSSNTGGGRREFAYNPDGSKRFISAAAPNYNSRDRNRGRGGRESRIVDAPATGNKGEQSTGPQLPWSVESDKRFFQGAQAKLRKYSGDYYDFQEFYKRFLTRRPSKTQNSSKNASSKNVAKGSLEGKERLQMEEMPSSHAFLSGIFAGVKEPTTTTSPVAASAEDLEDEWKAIEECLTLYDKFLQQKREEAGRNVGRQRRMLPVFAFRETILEMIRSNQVCIVAAETGAGKSTQVPQYLLEDGYSRIACTQPRRIACISLAQRVKHERLGWPGATGDDVGYQIRFEKSHVVHTSKDDRDISAGPVGPKLLFLTEGIILRQIRNDPLLKQYDLIIIDEVHERHAMVDFLLGLLRNVLPVRPELKLVLMSATIQADLFSNYFSQCPLITVPGKTFPVQIEHSPLKHAGRDVEDLNLVDDRMREEREKYKEEMGYLPSIQAPSHRFDPKPFQEILQLIDAQFSPADRGHVLIFMSGYDEITKLYDALETYARESQKWILLKLHSTLSMKQQDKVFLPTHPGVRKCIISTNIAETSVTLPEIRFIIDSGRVKELQWDPDVRMRKLQEVWISQASAKQRAGRAGRTGPGICWRLYSEREYESLNDYSTAELVRGLSLEQIILQMKAMSSVNSMENLGDDGSAGVYVHPQQFVSPDIPLALTTGRLSKMDLSDPRNFEFLQRPPAKHLDESLQLLRQVGALDDFERVTLLGDTLSLLPLDVILGKMLIYGQSFQVADWSMVMSAGLSVQTPFLRDESSKNNPLDSMTSTTTVTNSGSYDWKKEKERIEMAEGDPFTLIRLMQEWLTVQKRRTMPTRKWCSKLSVEEQRLYEMIKLIQQFKGIVGRQRSAAGDGRKGKKSSRQWENFDKWQREKHLGSGSSSQTDAQQQLLTLNSAKDDYDADSDSGGANFEFDEGGTDLLSLEFHARHHIDDLYDEFAAVPFYSVPLAEKIMLQLVLCSGLYPNIAIPDESNSTRRPADHVYHTKFKRFVMIHPSSAYAKHTNWVPQLKPSHAYDKSSKNGGNHLAGMSAFKMTSELQMADDGTIDIADVSEMETRFDRQRRDRLRKKRRRIEGGFGDDDDEEDEFDPASQTAPNYPAFLCYVQLMETNKPYLTNVFTVPALLSCFLFSHSIDTNSDFSLIVIDDWVLIELKSLNRYAGTDKQSPVTRSGMELIARMMKFRDEWHRRVNLTLQSSSSAKTFNRRNRNDDVSPLTYNKSVMTDESITSYMNENYKELFQRLLTDNRNAEPRAERPVDDFMRHLEMMIALDRQMLDEMGVYYELDTVKDDDLKTLFNVKVSQEDVPQQLRILPRWSYEREKVGINVSNVLTLGSIHFPRSILDDPEPLVDSADATVDEETGNATILGTRRSVKSVWQCLKCGKVMMVTESEKEQHGFTCDPSKVEQPPDASSNKKAGQRISITEYSAPSDLLPPSTEPLFLAPADHRSSSSASTASMGASGQCRKCGQILSALTPIQKLKHKQTCGKY